MHAWEYHDQLVIGRMTGAALQSQVLETARVFGWRSYHTYDSRRSSSGFPDLVLVRPPRLLFAELKTTRGRVDPFQQLWLDALSAVARTGEDLTWAAAPRRPPVAARRHRRQQDRRGAAVTPSMLSVLACRIDFLGPIPAVRPDLGPCWLWRRGLTKKGYAQRVSLDGVRVQPYRLFWEELHGPMPAGTVSDHLCRVRRCVDPKHIELVTTRVNVLRGEGVAARRSTRSHCPQGHPYSPANTRHYRGRRYCRACNNNGGHGRTQEVLGL